MLRASHRINSFIIALAVGLVLASLLAQASVLRPNTLDNSLSALQGVHPVPQAQRLAQRQRYQRALEQLKQGDYAGFSQLKQQLRSYPLHRYLDYQDFKHNVRRLKSAEVDHFLDRYADSFLSRYARGVWLWELSRRQDWNQFLSYYDQRSDRSLACYAAWAKIKVAKLSQRERMALAKDKYRVAYSQPDACDPIFAWLKARGGLSQTLIWQRVELALDKRNWKLARALAKQLTGRYQQQYQAWLDVRRNPEIIAEARFHKDTVQHRKLALYAVNRVLAKDLVEAETLWVTLKARYVFADEARYALDRRLAIRSAQRHYDDALSRFLALPREAVNERTREWRVRAALRTQDWRGALQGLLVMPAEEQMRDEWVYWRGRAEHELGNRHVARLAYERLAQKRGYYSFLAAERLGRGYAFTPDSPQVNINSVKALAATPTFQRVQELLAVEQMNYARVEWARGIKDLDKSGQLAAAQLAHRWGWHEQAIRIAASLGHYDDLDLRFAMPYREHVESHAEQVGIDPNWAQAIMRRESAYAPDARSSVGARGLMQLMPNTAKHVARQQGWRWQGVKKLNQPELNIQFGTAYLAELSDEHQNEIALATAAYNAGPHRVRKWMPKEGEQLPMDIWIDTIPFDETRKYVHAVSEYRNIFKWRSEGQPQQYRQPSFYTQKTVSGSLLATNTAIDVY